MGAVVLPHAGPFIFYYYVEHPLEEPWGVHGESRMESKGISQCKGCPYSWHKDSGL